VNPDDDIHLIATMKGFILPQFYYMKTHYCHNRMQIDMTTTNDRPNRSFLDACHCMSLPSATQIIQFYLGDDCGLACAVASLQNGSKIKERPTQKFISTAR
jgi:hypothetical protein